MVKFQEEIRSCTKCGLCKLMPFQPLAGIGPITAKIFICGEFPNYDESIEENLLVGLSGKFLRKCLEDVEIKYTECYISNILKCRPTNNGKKIRQPKKNEVTACIDWIYKEIELVKPQIVLTLGSLSASYIRFEKKIMMKNIVGTMTKYENKNYSNFTCQTLSTWSPSCVLMNGRERTKEFISHLKTLRDYINDI